MVRVSADKIMDYIQSNITYYDFKEDIEYYANKITDSDFKELSKNFVAEYRAFVEGCIKKTPHKDAEVLFTGWVDNLFLKISFNIEKEKVYFDIGNYTRKIKDKKFYILKKRFGTTQENKNGYIRLKVSDFYLNLPKVLCNTFAKNLGKDITETKPFKSACLLHRLILAIYLEFEENEEGHHLNKNIKDNKFENLVKATKKRHSYWHNEAEKTESFNPMDFDNLNDYDEPYELKSEKYWKNEIDERNNAYKNAQTKKKNYSYKTDDEQLFRICYYYYIAKKHNGKEYTLEEIEYKLAGINKKGCYSSELVRQVKNEYRWFDMFFACKCYDNKGL